MATPPSFWPESWQTVAPWLLATAATVAACVILSLFVDTLHQSIRRGDAIRAALATQGATMPATTGIGVADASTQPILVAR